MNELKAFQIYDADAAHLFPYSQNYDWKKLAEIGNYKSIPSSSTGEIQRQNHQIKYKRCFAESLQFDAELKNPGKEAGSDFFLLQQNMKKNWSITSEDNTSGSRRVNPLSSGV